MTKKEYDKNSVNGTKTNFLEGSSLGQFLMGRQVGSDRQTATVAQSQTSMQKLVIILLEKQLATTD